MKYKRETFIDIFYNKHGKFLNKNICLLSIIYTHVNFLVKPYDKYLYGHLNICEESFHF